MIPGQAQQFFEAAAAQAGGGDLEVLRSLRFNSADSAYLNRTPSSAGNRKTWTWSCWAKRSSVADSNWRGFFTALNPDNANRNDGIWYSGSGGTTDQLYVSFGDSTDIQFLPLYRDVSAWYHIVVSVDTTQSTASDRIKAYVNGVQLSVASGSQPAQDYEAGINNTTSHSIGRRDTSNAQFFDGYLANVQFIDGQALAATNFGEYDDNNVWQPKTYSGSYGTNGFYLKFDDNSSDAALGTDSSGNSNTWTVNNLTAAANGVTSFSYTNVTNPSNILDGDTNTGATFTATNAVFDAICNITGITQLEFYLYDGSGDAKGQMQYRVNGGSYTNASFNQTNTYVWNDATSLLTNGTLTSFGFKLSGSANGGARAARYTTSEGTFYILNTPIYNIDSVLDTPKNYEADSGNNGGNYPTLDAVARIYSTNGGVGQSGVYSNGNLTSTGAGVWSFGMSSIAIPSSGKWYCEMKGDGDSNVGIASFVKTLNATIRDSDTSNAVWYAFDGKIWSRYSGQGSTTTVTTGLATWQNGKTLGIAVNVDDEEIKFYVENSLQYTYSLPSQIASVLTDGKMHFMTDTYYGSHSVSVNFGQQGFLYTPPTDHIALCAQNLPDPTIAEGSTAMDVALYTGNSTARNITGLNMSPDLVWIKKRSGSGNHSLADTVRGATKNIVPNDTQAEGTEPTYVTAFNSDGFSLGASSIVNNNGDTYVSWNWDAGTSNSTITAGSLNSSFYDQSAVWSNMCSPAPSINSYVQGFDGSLTTTFAGGISPGSYFTFTPTGGGITFTDKVRVYNGNVSGASYQYNGNSAQTFTANAWNTVATGGGTMTSFAVTRSSTDVHGWYAIEVDGKILVDQGTTPAANIPAVDSTVRANTTSGFSIVSYTGNGTSGSRIGHGLNATPEMVIFKNRDTSPTDWRVYNTMVDESLDILFLNLTSAKSDSGLTTFTSTTFTAGASNETNGNGDAMIAYCFAPVAGYSAFGSYTGNGSTNGPFVNTGMEPAFLLIKRTDSGSNWQIRDSARQPDNVDGAWLFANLTNAEESSSVNPYLDKLSNGFKLRGTSGDTNAIGGTYIYAAFAEHPFKFARAR
jgi:hypothetical protein